MADIFKNPTQSEFLRLIKENGPLRAARDHANGDVYVWPAESGLHNEVISKLPQNGMIDSAGTLFDFKDYMKLSQPKRQRAQ
jgi:hypothetical protein